MFTHHWNCVRESVFPSGSLNHATFAPEGDVQIPNSSWGSPSKCSNRTPLFANSFNFCANIMHLPAKNYMTRGNQFRNFLHAQHCALGIEHNRKRVIADKHQTQRL